MPTSTELITEAAPSAPTLRDVLDALKGNMTLSEIRRRDLSSAVRRVAFLLGDEPSHIVLNVPVIAAKLAAINPVGAGLTNKRFITVRSDFMAAVSASGLRPIPRVAKAPLSYGWKKFMAELSAKRAHLGLSRLARYASAKGLEPDEINNAALADFINAVRQRTLHRKTE